MSYFQLFSCCLDILMKHYLLCYIYYFYADMINWRPVISVGSAPDFRAGGFKFEP